MPSYLLMGKSQWEKNFHLTAKLPYDITLVHTVPFTIFGMVGNAHLYLHHTVPRYKGNWGSVPQKVIHLLVVYGILGIIPLFSFFPFYDIVP